LKFLKPGNNALFDFYKNNNNKQQQEQ